MDSSDLRSGCKIKFTVESTDNTKEGLHFEVRVKYEKIHIEMDIRGIPRPTCHGDMPFNILFKIESGSPQFFNRRVADALQGLDKLIGGTRNGAYT